MKDLEFEGYVDHDRNLQDISDGRGEYEPPYLLSEGFVNNLLSKVSGKVYTVIEATVDVPKQKATKDILRNIFGEAMADVVKHATNDDYINHVTGGKTYDTLEEDQAAVN